MSGSTTAKEGGRDAPRPVAPGPVAIVAGGGSLPVEVARHAKAGGFDPLVVAIRGEADAAIAAFDPVWVEWGQIGRMISAIEARGCRDMVLIGGIGRRPEFGAMVSDMATLRRIPKILKALIGGDGDVLDKVLRMIEDEGFRVIGAHEIAPQLLAGAGPLTARKPNAARKQDIAVAIGALDALGAHDIGQGVVVANRRIVAVEAAEGTDSMLARCADLVESGRISRKAVPVLVKAAKPGQDQRVDLPAVGPRTVEGAKAAGLSGIAVEAGKVLIAEREAMIAAADKAGLFVYGFERGRDG